MTWDVTVTDTLAESYLLATSSTAGVAATEGAADRKELNANRWLTPTLSFRWLSERVDPSGQRAHTFLTHLADVYQLAPATCEKLLS